MARIEHYDDPNAPKPNSLVPAASAVVTNDRGEILMQRRVDNNFWALPGGTMDFGETIVQTAEREVREETGLDVHVDGIVGTFSDPATSSSTATARFASSSTSASTRGSWAASSARATNQATCGGSRPRSSKELEIHHTTRLRVEHFLQHPATPYLG